MLDFNAASVSTRRNACTAVGTTVIPGLNWAGNMPVGTTGTPPCGYNGFKNPVEGGPANELGWLISFDSACTKSLTVQIASRNETQHFNVEVNGIVVATNIAYTATGSGSKLNYQTLAPITGISFKAGPNSLRFLAVENHGLSNNEAFGPLTFA